MPRLRGGPRSILPGQVRRAAASDPAHAAVRAAGVGAESDTDSGGEPFGRYDPDGDSVNSDDDSQDEDWHAGIDDADGSKVSRHKRPKEPWMGSGAKRPTPAAAAANADNDAELWLHIGVRPSTPGAVARSLTRLYEHMLPSSVAAIRAAAAAHTKTSITLAGYRAVHDLVFGAAAPPKFPPARMMKHNARRFVRVLLRGSRAGLEGERLAAAVKECLVMSSTMMVVGRARLEGKYGLRPAACALPVTVEGMCAVNAEVDAAELAG